MIKVDEKELERRAEVTIDDYAGIVPYFEAMYLQSIIYAAARSVESFARLKSLEDLARDPDFAVSIAQEAIGHAAAVSRFFWPTRGGLKEVSAVRRMRAIRGERLRSAFSLDEQSPLADRELRNTWEHFDERLDSYMLQADAGVFLPGCLIGDHQIADDPVGHTFKVLDPDAECLVLLGRKYFYGEIRREVNRVLEVARESERGGGRLPRATEAM